MTHLIILLYLVYLVVAVAVFIGLSLYLRRTRADGLYDSGDLVIALIISLLWGFALPAAGIGLLLFWLCWRWAEWVNK